MHSFKSNKRHRVNVVGDKGYTSNKYKTYLAKHKIHYIIPKKKNQTKTDMYTYYNTDLLKKRHVVENYFAHIKQYTRIRFVYDKMVYIYEGFLLLSIMNQIAQI